MSDLKEVFGEYFKDNRYSPTSTEHKKIFITDKCPKCGSTNYVPTTNDKGSIRTCLKCNTTYRSWKYT